MPTMDLNEAYLAHGVDKLGDDGRSSAPGRLIVVNVSVWCVRRSGATSPNLHQPALAH